jgi:hypothetical protein
VEHIDAWKRRRLLSYDGLEDGANASGGPVLVQRLIIRVGHGICSSFESPKMKQDSEHTKE